MVTLKEIAKECGVSATTVSNILNGRKNVGEATRKQVMDVVERTGYKPNVMAKSLRSSKTKTIGIIAEDFTQFTVPQIIDGAIETCYKHGYKAIVQNLRLYAVWRDQGYDDDTTLAKIVKPALDELGSIMVDGILYIAGHGRSISIPRPIGIPTVLAYSYPSNMDRPYYVIDDKNGAYELVSYLVRKGHRRIGVIGGTADSIHTRLRLEGYQRALFEAQIFYDPSLIRYTTWTKDGGYREMAHMIEKGVTAVFCMNDLLAGGAYRYCAEHNLKVGEDISIVGYDNEQISEYLIPELTTMEIPLYRFGESGTEKLISMIEGTEGPALQAGDSRTVQGDGTMLHCIFKERASVKDLN